MIPGECSRNAPTLRLAAASQIVETYHRQVSRAIVVLLLGVFELELGCLHRAKSLGIIYQELGGLRLWPRILCS